jgi:hypothetical protein
VQRGVPRVIPIQREGEPGSAAGGQRTQDHPAPGPAQLRQPANNPLQPKLVEHGNRATLPQLLLQ